MTNNEDIVEKFSQSEVSLSYEQIQDIKNGHVAIVLKEHLGYSHKLLKRNKVLIFSGCILLTIGFYLALSSNLGSLIPTVVTGLGAGTLSWGITQFNRARSYQADIRSLKEHFANKMPYNHSL